MRQRKEKSENQAFNPSIKSHVPREVFEALFFRVNEGKARIKKEGN
jgi:hypothetical protein